jgi:hypothetical protein
MSDHHAGNLFSETHKVNELSLEEAAERACITAECSEVMKMKDLISICSIRRSVNLTNHM